MKKSIFVILTALLFSGILPNPLSADNGFSVGAHFMAGGRYDNLRMCVGSDAGVKGGPMADIQLAVKYRADNEYAVSFHLPVMRPILFWTAFDMVQFEPEFTFEYRIPASDKISFVTGPGLGLSLHYGPDYKSDLDNRSDDFFAAGPYLSYMFGIMTESGNVLGLRAVYVPLFSGELSTGTVIAAALEYTVFF